MLPGPSAMTPSENPSKKPNQFAIRENSPIVPTCLSIVGGPEAQLPLPSVLWAILYTLSFVRTPSFVGQALAYFSRMLKV